MGGRATTRIKTRPMNLDGHYGMSCDTSLQERLDCEASSIEVASDSISDSISRGLLHPGIA